MSTLKTTYIQHPSSPDPNIELNADGSVNLSFVVDAPQDGQVLTFNASEGKWEAKDLVMKEKKIAAFTGNGTWTVPAGVTYAIAHMMGGGGGVGDTGSGSAGSASSVNFASGLVSAPGSTKTMAAGNLDAASSQAGAANSGQSATSRGVSTSTSGVPTNGSVTQYIVAGAAVTPAASISVVVGAGGTAGTNGAAGGSGYVYIEYYE